MPVEVKSLGGGRYQAGPEGKIYSGPGAKEKATKQAAAIRISMARAKGHKIPKKDKSQ